MTFTVRHRGAPGLRVHEYLCPVHGRFEMLLVDAPDEERCPFVEYECPHDPDVCRDCGDCDLLSPHVISAPKPKNLSIVPTAVVRGGDTERRPNQLDTRSLGDGGSMKDWRAAQDKGRQERRYHQLVSKGLKTKRIQVG